MQPRTERHAHQVMDTTVLDSGPPSFKESYWTDPSICQRPAAPQSLWSRLMDYLQSWL